MQKEKIALRVLYVLAVYILLQLLWWGYQLIDLNAKIVLSEQTDVHVQFQMLRKKVWMVAGEGVVFFILLAIGFRYIKRIVSRELALARQEKNFLLSVTHELKTPISAVKLFLETMKARALDEDQRAKMIGQALQETKRLQSLSENILLATRMDQHTEGGAFFPVDLGELVKRESDRFILLHPNRIRWTADKNQIVFGDEQMLAALVVNLIDNALKYGAQNEIIKVSVKHEDNRIVLRVADNGKGIPLEERKKVFQKFYRSGSEETRTARGTGLGLFIVASVAKLHKAEVEIMDNDPQGSIFVVRMNELKNG
jgi:signal transduction histidine kinase